MITEGYSHKIILFDGVCNFCNSSVNFVIRNDFKDRFKFAAIQSDIGGKLISLHEIDLSQADSVILIDYNHVYIKSTAVLRILKDLQGVLPVLYSFIIIPNFIRNKLYDIIARNRYNWFGKKHTCLVPTKKMTEKFL